MTGAQDTHVDTNLGSLAVAINREYEAVKAAFQEGIEHAIKAGDLLIEAKKAVPYGKWETWLRDNCCVSERMAQRYMAIAKVFPELEPAEATRVSGLSLRAALAELAVTSDREAAETLRSKPQFLHAVVFLEKACHRVVRVLWTVMLAC